MVCSPVPSLDSGQHQLVGVGVGENLQHVADDDLVRVPGQAADLGLDPVRVVRQRQADVVHALDFEAGKGHVSRQIFGREVDVDEISKPA